MKDTTYAAIMSALDRLRLPPDGVGGMKINGVNLAKEAGVSKATLYRYFEMYVEIRAAFDSARARGLEKKPAASAKKNDSPGESELSVSDLKRNIAELKSLIKARDAQLCLLWSENRRLLKELENLSSSGGLGENVVPFPRGVR